MPRESLHVRSVYLGQEGVPAGEFLADVQLHSICICLAAGGARLIGFQLINPALYEDFVRPTMKTNLNLTKTLCVLVTSCSICSHRSRPLVDLLSAGRSTSGTSDDVPDVAHLVARLVRAFNAAAGAAAELNTAAWRPKPLISTASTKESPERG